jgi:hypothetical protein
MLATVKSIPRAWSSFFRAEYGYWTVTGLGAFTFGHNIFVDHERREHPAVMTIRLYPFRTDR